MERERGLYCGISAVVWDHAIKCRQCSVMHNNKVLSIVNATIIINWRRSADHKGTATSWCLQWLAQHSNKCVQLDLMEGPKGATVWSVGCWDCLTDDVRKVQLYCVRLPRSHLQESVLSYIPVKDINPVMSHRRSQTCDVKVLQYWITTREYRVASTYYVSCYC